MNARERLAALLGPEALDELDACVATAPPLSTTAATELAAVIAAELAPEPQAA